MQAKRRGNVPPSRDALDREERVSLIRRDQGGSSDGRNRQRRHQGQQLDNPFRREKRKTSTLGVDVVDGGYSADGDDDDYDDDRGDNGERVSLIGGGGGGGASGRKPTTGGSKMRPLRIANTKIKRRGTAFSSFFQTTTGSSSWNMSRMMRYGALMMVSATFSFLLLRRQSKTIHWEEYHKILEPDVGPKETRCYEQGTGTKDTRCTCPNPSTALANTTTALWMSHHKSMVHIAQHAHENIVDSDHGGLDVVFFGDDMMEQLGGSRNLGAHDAEGMEAYFDRRFTLKGGGKLEAVALGSTGDIGPNLLWHLENGILQANLGPKLWFVMVGGNDLFQSRCTDRFVVANILNVLKRLHESQPESQFIVHGIMPRTDSADVKSGKLGHLWKRAQGINLQVRKLTQKAVRLHYINAGPKFTKDSGVKGRQYLDNELMVEGSIPTSKGMQIWGDFIEKRIQEILHGKELKNRGKSKQPQDEGEER